MFLIEQKLLEFEDWLKPKPFSGTTVRLYRTLVTNYLRYCKARAFNITPAALHEYPKQYIEHLRGSDFATSTLSANIIAIRHFHHFLGIDANELPQFSRDCALQKTPIKALTRHQQECLLSVLDSCQNAKHKAIFRLFLFAGLKLGECADLNVEDLWIDSDRVELTAGRTTSRRRIALNKVEQEVLLLWISERRKIEGNHAERALFINENGNRISALGLDYIIRRIGQLARVELSAQVLRNTCIANMVSRGCTADDAARFVGRKTSAGLKLVRF